MYNPYKITLPFVDYITVSHDTTRSKIPNTSEQIVFDKSEQEEPAKKRISKPALGIKQGTPEEVKIDTEAYVPITRSEETPKKERPKIKTVSYTVQTPFTQQTPLVPRSAENKEWGTPWFSSVQVTNNPVTYVSEQSNLSILNKPTIKISEGVDLTDEVENNILRKMYELGVSGHITSNIRKGAVAPNGNPSYHSWGDAFDLQPVKDDSPEAHAILYQQMKTSGFLKYLNDLGYYVYYEDESINPNSTGRHFHIGKDIKANNPYVVKASDGLKFKSQGIADSRNFFQRLLNIHPHPTSGPVDLDKLKRRQAWAESNNSPKAVSGAGAVGTYQITPAVHSEYINRTGHKGELTDPAYNEQVRDWYFNERIPEHYFVNARNPTDSVRIAKQLAAYNAGPNSVMNKLVKAKKDGVDIYNTFDWLPYMPKETRDYVEFILRNKDTGGNRTNVAYEKHMK